MRPRSRRLVDTFCRRAAGRPAPGSAGEGSRGRPPGSVTRRRCRDVAARGSQPERAGRGRPAVDRGREQHRAVDHTAAGGAVGRDADGRPFDRRGRINGLDRARGWRCGLARGCRGMFVRARYGRGGPRHGSGREDREEQEEYRERAPHRASIVAASGRRVTRLRPRAERSPRGRCSSRTRAGPPGHRPAAREGHDLGRAADLARRPGGGDGVVAGGDRSHPAGRRVARSLEHARERVP